VHVTRDGGGNWTDATPPGMPRFGTVNRIEASRHANGRAFLAVQRYRLDDWKPYVFRTDDFGKTWALLTDGTNGIPANHPVRVVREDPDRRGLLYAGTEFGIFVSFDDGRRWQTLQLNLPLTPVTDIAVHRKDVVVSTQGRSFWLLDDVAPLHQVSDEVARATAHLYRPRDAYRVDRGAQTGGLQDEFAADPAPAGATLYYYLANAPTSPVAIEIRDAQQRVVRTFSSDSARADSLRTQRLPARRGSHRFTWDLAYDGPRAPRGVVVWGYQGGVKAPPGIYQVQLTVAGQTYTQPLRVQPDPRITTVAQADYDEQLRFASMVRDTLNAVYAALTSLRDVRTQVSDVLAKAKQMGGSADLAPLGDTLNAHLGVVEDDLVQKRSQSGQDPIRFGGKLDNQLAELYGNLTGVNGYIAGGVDGRPTRAAQQRMQELSTQWVSVRQRFLRILETEVPAFNAAVVRAGIPPIAVRARPIT